VCPTRRAGVRGLRGRQVRAGWGIGVVTLVVAGGLLAGLVLGSAPGARTAATRALGALPAPLRPDVVVLAEPAQPAQPAVPAVPAVPAAPRPDPVPTRIPALPPMTPPSLPRATTTPSPESAPPCAPTARACVDLSANRSWLLQNGRVTYGPVPITSGRPGFRTPPGTFTVASKRRDHVSSIYDAEMPWSVFFNGGVAFHEGSLTVTSHGCIHLSPEAAETYFSELSVGDVVQVVR
jgi:lipoprotein-anchoring transpeptidase ErfK/SrfK